MKICKISKNGQYFGKKFRSCWQNMAYLCDGNRNCNEKSWIDTLVYHLASETGTGALVQDTRQLTLKE